MNILIIMLPLALLLAFGFLAAFITLALRGQFDDLDSPSHRMLSDSGFDSPLDSPLDSEESHELARKN